MTVEEEIAQTIDKALDGDCGDGVGESLAARLAPLLNRVRAEALREAARFLGTLHGEKVAANILEMYAREIEQNSEGKS